MNRQFMEMSDKQPKDIGKWADKQINTYRNKRPNILGICNCPVCIRGRAGIKSGRIMTLKRKLHNWKSNKPAQKGAYTD